MSGISDRNPFVGPRPIQQGEALYGRSREIRELYNRLQARRVVVLHSPSGAGKSSLVHAGLIPKLREASFDVWRPIRVNLDPSGLEGVPPGTNRYLLSAMLSLEEELAPERRRNPAALVGMDFLSYLDSRPRRKNRQDQPAVLLFDQFEELLTIAPRATAEKRAFFESVGAALGSERYWALFILREDYLAAFTPYRDLIPTHMSNTFRLNLLDLEGAREVAVQLARQGGREFPGVDKLIRDLATVQVQQPDGSFVAEQGSHVEPVHLQVVGRRLWEAMPDGDRDIDEADVAHYAEPSKALADYYQDIIERVANRSRTVERALRQWVGERLIVGGVRSQVRQEAKESGGLDNGLIQQLVGSYLVRTEQRASSTWFELGHDRMVEPVGQNNEEWDRANLHMVQVQAKEWVSLGKPETRLELNLARLKEAEHWAENNGDVLSPGELEYLQQSRAAIETRAAEERRHRLRVMVLTVATAVSLVAAVVAIFLYQEAQTATKEAEAALKKSDQLKRAGAEVLVYMNERAGLNRTLEDRVYQAETENNPVEAEKYRKDIREWFSSTLARGMYLSTHEYVLSPNRSHIAIQHDDGSFCTYRGNDPRGDLETVWCSRAGGPIGEYYSIIVANKGRFCTFEGNDPTKQGKEFWCTPLDRSVSASTRVFGRIEDDGHFRIFEGKPELKPREIGRPTSAESAGPSERLQATKDVMEQMHNFLNLDEQERIDLIGPAEDMEGRVERPILDGSPPEGLPEPLPETSLDRRQAPPEPLQPGEAPAPSAPPEEAPKLRDAETPRPAAAVPPPGPRKVQPPPPPPEGERPNPPAEPRR